MTRENSSTQDLEAAEFAAAIDQHRRHPEISLEDHIQACHVQLGRSLSSRKAIYLDTKFWLYFRDVELGRPIANGSAELLEFIRELVKVGAAFCPLSDVTLIEILKQDDPASRLATARLVDELSMSAALAPQELRVRTEVAHFVHDTLLQLEVSPLSWLVWQSITFSMGVRLPVFEWVESQERVALQKAFFDRMAGHGLFETLQMSKNQVFERLPFDRVATKLQALNKAYEDEITSYAIAYRREVFGTVDLFVETAVEVIRVRPTATGLLKGVSTFNDEEVRKVGFASIAAALLNEGMVRKLPTLHVMCVTHAQQRWDKKRRMKANDIPDFDHAAAAIPYCSAFLTEKPLAAFVNNGPGRISKLHPCEVLADPTSALAGLKGIFGSAQ